MPIHDWTRVDAGIFHDFHLSWLAAIKRVLNAGLLPPDYYALTEQYAGPGQPDVLALHSPVAPPGNGSHAGGWPETGGVALRTEAPPVHFHDRADDEVYAPKGRAIAIRRTNGDRVVAVIEVVSPGNKGSKAALRAFVTKAADYLVAGVHLLVLDLFPPSARDPQGIHPALWSEFVDRPFTLPSGKSLTLAAYSAGVPKEAFVQPVGVGDPLPEMPLYLTPGAYVAVPLEATYQAAWAEVPPRWQRVIQPPPA